MVGSFEVEDERPRRPSGSASTPTGPPNRMPRSKIVTAAEAANLVPDGCAIGVTGGGGGLVEPESLLEAIERRYLQTGSPAGLTLVHALGLGDRHRKGVNRFAHAGMVKRVIGGHWVWSPRMQAMAQSGQIEAYVLPAGVITHLMREIGAGRAGLITHVGLGTFVDPRVEGGKMNDAAREDLVELIEIDGRTLLRYKPFPVGAVCIRGSLADADGNLCLKEEGATLDALSLALAAHNSGGKVLAQVRQEVPRGSLPARSVSVPGAMVDAVIVDPSQKQSYSAAEDPAVSGSLPAGDGRSPRRVPAPLDARRVIARRAAMELRADAILNYGFGIPDAIAKLVAFRGEVEEYYQTIEHGTYGGELLDGALFGFARNPRAMIDSPSQFDFYSGGGLDLAFLGMGEVDQEGNVNVSKLGGVPVGPGGFIDIAQNAAKVVFCGTFEAKGAVHQIGGGCLRVTKHGAVRKFRSTVDQITFSGREAVRSGQEALYVTERAVFRLSADGLVLQEVAPGIDLQADVLDRMDFLPLMDGTPGTMVREIFREREGQDT